MKVIRSYTDYYDGVLGNFSQEQVPFYNRKKIKVDDIEYNRIRGNLPNIQGVSVIPYKTEKTKYLYSWNSHQIDLETSVIGFCGKLYVVFYKSALFDEITHAYPDVKLLSDSFTIVKHLWDMHVETIVNRWTNEKTLLDIFVKFKVPSFLYTNKSLILNPCLNDFNMQKIIHPYTAVQELEMFLNNTLCVTNTPTMPVGDDITLAQSKGFDKWSFRKIPKPNKNKKDN